MCGFKKKGLPLAWSSPVRRLPPHYRNSGLEMRATTSGYPCSSDLNSGLHAAVERALLVDSSPQPGSLMFRTDKYETQLDQTYPHNEDSLIQSLARRGDTWVGLGLGLE